MGHGGYSHSSRLLRSEKLGYATNTNEQTFTNHSCPADMSPLNMSVREARDSKEHPNSVPIIIGLDVTGSMGNLPQHIVRDGLPAIIKKLQAAGIADPQILFLGIGDHVYDKAPIQVGQFESSDELLDKWLTGVYLEGRGGGNTGESYLLGWLIGAKYTALDSLEKRNQKGFLFTIGDEPLLENIDQKSLNNIFGSGFQASLSQEEIYKMASEKYHVVHFHTTETGSGQNYESTLRASETANLLGQDLTFISNVEELAEKITEIVSTRVGANPVAAPDADVSEPEAETPAEPETPML